MKFRTQLIISMGFFAVALAIISASMIATNQQVERLNKQEDLTKDIELKVGELSYLSNDYLLYHESQQIDRWESKYSSISEDVSNLTVDRPEQQVHVNNIKTSQQQLKEIFGDIVSRINSASSLQRNAVDPGFIQVSSSRLGVQTQGILFDASRLSLMLRDQANQTHQKNTVLVFSLIGAFIALLLANYLIFYRGTLRSIEFLQTGTKIIGSGNLDFSLEEKRNDEIGELSRSFNRMTANLKTVTASKKDLEREIVERRQAEAALQESELKYSLLFERSAVAASLTKLPENVFADVNEAFEKLFGYTRQEVIGKTSLELGISKPEEHGPLLLRLKAEVCITMLKSMYVPNQALSASSYST